MKYKAGDKVRIKSLDWYNRHTNGTEIDCGGVPFTSGMKWFCSCVMTISFVHADYYDMVEDSENYYTDEMIEGLVETPKFKKGDCVKCSDGSTGIIVTYDWSDSLNCYQYYIDYIGTLDAGYQSEKDLQSHSITTMNGRDIFEGAKWKHEFECPEGYQFKDDNGNVINATKIVLEKKKKEYPKTYEECCEIVKVGKEHTLEGTTIRINYKIALLESLQKLLICRDAYWKIAGDEMGLGRPWKPNDSSGYCTYAILRHTGHIRKSRPCADSALLEFPTAEMRDAFYENFKELMEQCKELL